jgi:hypothetical protein
VSEEQDQGSGQSSESKWDFSGVPENTRDLQPTADWFALPDISLQRMATWADSMGQGTVVTLVVPGGLISGTVESASDYFTGMSRQFQDSIAELGDEKKNGVAKEFAEFFFDEPAKVYADKVEADTEACLLHRSRPDVSSPRAHPSFTEPGRCVVGRRPYVRCR